MYVRIYVYVYVCSKIFWKYIMECIWRGRESELDIFGKNITISTTIHWILVLEMAPGSFEKHWKDSAIHHQPVFSEIAYIIPLNRNHMAFSGLTVLTKYPEHFGIALFVDFCSSSRKWWSWLWLGENYTECLGYIAIAKHFSIMIIVIIIVSMIMTTIIPIIVIAIATTVTIIIMATTPIITTTITFTIIISDRVLLLWLPGTPVIQASYFFWPLLQTCKWLGWPFVWGLLAGAQRSKLLLFFDYENPFQARDHQDYYRFNKRESLWNIPFIFPYPNDMIESFFFAESFPLVLSLDSSTFSPIKIYTENQSDVILFLLFGLNIGHLSYIILISYHVFLEDFFSYRKLQIYQFWGDVNIRSTHMMSKYACVDYLSLLNFTL